MEAARFEQDRRIAAERVETYRRIEAERLEDDNARTARLAAAHLEEDAVRAKMVADKRLETDRRLAAEGLGHLHAVIAAERLKVDAEKAALVASEREKAAGILSDNIKAERLKADVKLELGFLEADRRLVAERLESDRRLQGDSRLGAALLGGKRPAAAGSPDSRKHRRTVDSKEKVELIAEMKRVFAEHFEENSGAIIVRNELYNVFSRSTRLATFNKNDFSFHSRSVFMLTWPNVVCSTYRNNRSYVGVAVK